MCTKKRHTAHQAQIRVVPQASYSHSGVAASMHERSVGHAGEAAQAVFLATAEVLGALLRLECLAQHAAALKPAFAALRRWFSALLTSCVGYCFDTF